MSISRATVCHLTVTHAIVPHSSQCLSWSNRAGGGARETRMAFAKIRIDFDAIDKSYPDNKSLPPGLQRWLNDQVASEKKLNEKITLENEEQLARGDTGKPKDLVHISTSCCMQMSWAFNEARTPIPQQGSTANRDNTPIGGKFFILAVGEFRAFLTYRYGPTDMVTDNSKLAGKKGILVFGGVHIEFWDGDNIFQSAAGIARRKPFGSKPDAVMSGTMVTTQPRWFWEIVDGKTEPAAVVPEWLAGWWTVYDGQYYYYYFFPDGNAVWIDVVPNPKWIPPKTIGNRGTVTMNDHGPTVLWVPTKGETVGTKEDFTQLNWSSITDMNGVSNKYSPLYAKKR